MHAPHAINNEVRSLGIFTFQRQLLTMLGAGLKVKKGMSNTHTEGGRIFKMKEKVNRAYSRNFLFRNSVKY